jgi:CRP-like cAMP-binding protein
LAYVEAKDYNRVLKQATVVDMQRKLKLLKANRFFGALSSNKLQKLQYYAKTLKIPRGQEIYKENEIVDGLYLIIKGSVKYS